MADIETRHDEKHQRYVAVLDGEPIGELLYRDTEEGRVFMHAEIDVAHEHHGFGTQMVRASLDDTRGDGIRPIAQCPMVRNFLAEHPDYARPLAR